MTVNENAAEEKRLEALQSYHILDSLTERDFEDITFLASAICQVPIALISFVDRDRQWFKSHKGLEIDQTAREFSFCAHAIQSPSESFVVNDARFDERFKNNPLVTGTPDIVFYAGIPLVTEDGQSLGTVCVIDTKPRDFTSTQEEALKILSRQVMQLLELRKLKVSLEQTNEVLYNANLDLELRLVNSTAVNKEVTNALESTHRELQAYSQISSHDLQEPLRKIQVFTARLEPKEKSALSDSGLDNLRRINTAAGKMRELLDGLSSHSGLTRSDKTIQHVSLQAIVKDIENDLEPDLVRKQGSIILENDMNLWVIHYQFRQLLFNVIQNALTFSRKGISPAVIISIQEVFGGQMQDCKLPHQEKFYLIKVQDNGRGFAKEYSTRIFEPFQTLPEVGELRRTGLGLTTAKKIAENHFGTIRAESEEGVGSVFYIYLKTQESA